MYNTSKILLCKNIFLGFLLGVSTMIVALFLYSTSNNPEFLIKFFQNFDSNFFIISLFIALFISGYLINKSKQKIKNLSGKLNITESLNRKLEVLVIEYQLILDTTSIITVIDPSGKIKKVNEHFEKFTGYKKDELIGRSLWRLPSSYQKAAVAEDIKNTIDNGEVWIGEIEYYKNSLTFYSKAIFIPLKRDLINNDCLVVQFDLTKEKELIKSLDNSEKEKDFIKSNTSDLICTHDVNGIITNINDAGVSHLGLKDKSVIGQSIQTILNDYKNIKNINSLEKEKTSTKHLKMPIKHFEADEIIYNSYCSPNQLSTYIVAKIKRNYEKENSLNSIENQIEILNQIVNESSDLICLFDSNNNIVFLNKKLRSFFRIKDDLAIKTLSDIIQYSNDFSRLTGHISIENENSTKYSVHECKIQEVETGKTKWFKVQKTIFNNNNLNKCVLIIANDISEIHNTHLELIKSSAVLENSLKTRENFIVNMSHEIRTPLNAIIGFCELLQDSILDKQQSDYLNTIKIAGHNLLGIINDILDLSKLESGNLQLSKDRINIKDTIKNVKKLFEPKILEKQIELNTSIDDDIPDFVLGDEMRLNQILINFVGNAVKFTNHGRVDIVVIKIKNLDPKIINLQFHIKDSGIGIEQDKLDLIFKPYAQANKDFHKLYGGTGLGLSISKSLIEILGGAIELSSQKGVGTNFSFILPLEVAEEHDNSIELKLETILNDCKPLHILLAEDNTTNAKLAIQILKKTAHTVLHVKDGLEVLNELNNNKYDIILMDVQMVCMDGIETAKQIRNSDKTYNKIPIIALTAHSFKGERIICFNAGMDGYLSKPYRSMDLLNCINNTIQNQQKLINKKIGLTE